MADSKEFREVKLFAPAANPPEAAATEDRGVVRSNAPYPTFSASFIPQENMSFAELADHAGAKPDDVRKAMMEIIKAIPDDDLVNAYAAQVILVT